MIRMMTETSCDVALSRVSAPECVPVMWVSQCRHIGLCMLQVEAIRVEPKRTRTPVHAGLTSVTGITRSGNYLNRKGMRLRVAAKLELCGFLLLLPGSSRSTGDARAEGLLSNGTYKSSRGECNMRLTRLQMSRSSSLFLSTCILIVA